MLPGGKLPLTCRESLFIEYVSCRVTQTPRLLRLWPGPVGSVFWKASWQAPLEEPVAGHLLVNLQARASRRNLNIRSLHQSAKPGPHPQPLACQPGREASRSLLASPHPAAKNKGWRGRGRKRSQERSPGSSVGPQGALLLDTVLPMGGQLWGGGE